MSSMAKDLQIAIARWERLRAEATTWKRRREIDRNLRSLRAALRKAP